MAPGNGGGASGGHFVKAMAKAKGVSQPVRAMKGRWVALTSLLIVLAGCAQGQAGAKQGQAEPGGLADLELEATETTGIIRGVVFDEAIRPIAGALVKLETGLPKTTTTNAQGAFGFDGLAEGNYMFAVEAATYDVVRQSAAVVAGEPDPAFVRVLLLRQPGHEPYFDMVHRTLFITSYRVEPPGRYLVSGHANFAVEPNATMAQGEFHWQETQQLAAHGRAIMTAYDQDFDLLHPLEAESSQGASPRVVRLNMTSAEGTAHYLDVELQANPSGGTPVGVMLNQQADVFVHVFYNMVPPLDWAFGEDGDPPIPTAR